MRKSQFLFDNSYKKVKLKLRIQEKHSMAFKRPRKFLYFTWLKHFTAFDINTIGIFKEPSKRSEPSSITRADDKLVSKSGMEPMIKNVWKL